jgi:hypothetical protein
MKMIRTAPYLLVLAALFASAPAQSASEGSLIWTERTDGGSVSLAYGSLDTAQNPLFLLSCFNEMDIVVLNIFSVIEGTRPGQPVTIEISGGSEKATLKAQSEIDRKSASMFAEAGEVEVEPLLTVLRADGPVTLKMGFTTKTMSDAGREQAVDQFRKDCRVS